jgi:hypothetical protein
VGKNNIIASGTLQLSATDINTFSRKIENPVMFLIPVRHVFSKHTQNKNGQS